MVLQVNVPAFVCLSNLLWSGLVRVYKPDEGGLGGHGYLGGSCPLYGETLPSNEPGCLPKAGNVISVTQTDQHWLLAPRGENPSDREGGEGRC